MLTNSYIGSDPPAAEYLDSTASNLVTGDANGVDDVFLHDTATGTTTRVSLGPSGAEGNGASVAGAISPDGGFVAIASDAAFVSSDTNAHRDIYLKCVASGVMRLVSHASLTEQANGDSFFPSVSWNGRSVCFHSLATNLVPDLDLNGSRDVFIRDAVLDITTLASGSWLGGTGNGTSWLPHLSPSVGRGLVFVSDASNLVSPDNNGTWDAFVSSTASVTTDVVSWGNNNYGQVSGTLPSHTLVRVAAGGSHSLALDEDGAIVGWGQDFYGNVSNAPTGADFTQVGAGFDHSIALASDGSLVSWGYDFAGVVSNTPSGTGYLQGICLADSRLG